MINNIEVFLYDYVTLKLAEDQTYHETPIAYDLDLAINEIPDDYKYDDLKVLLRCPEIQMPIIKKTLLADDTPK